jgi:hypothetical protein
MRAQAASLHVTSNPGDAAGGSTYAHNGRTSRIWVKGGRWGFDLQAEGWVARFKVPTGDRLMSGRRYVRTVNSEPGSGPAELKVSGPDLYCSETRGEFTVERVVFDSSGWIKAIRLSFAQHCEHSPLVLRGTLIWDPRAALGT